MIGLGAPGFGASRLSRLGTTAAAWRSAAPSGPGLDSGGTRWIASQPARAGGSAAGARSTGAAPAQGTPGQSASFDADSFIAELRQRIGRNALPSLDSIMGSIAPPRFMPASGSGGSTGSADMSSKGAAAPPGTGVGPGPSSMNAAIGPRWTSSKVELPPAAESRGEPGAQGPDASAGSGQLDEANAFAKGGMRPPPTSGPGAGQDLTQEIAGRNPSGRLGRGRGGGASALVSMQLGMYGGMTTPADPSADPTPQPMKDALAKQWAKFEAQGGGDQKWDRLEEETDRQLAALARDEARRSNDRKRTLASQYAKALHGSAGAYVVALVLLGNEVDDAIQTAGAAVSMSKLATGLAEAASATVDKVAGDPKATRSDLNRGLKRQKKAVGAAIAAGKKANAQIRSSIAKAKAALEKARKLAGKKDDRGHEAGHLDAALTALDEAEGKIDEAEKLEAEAAEALKAGNPGAAANLHEEADDKRDEGIRLLNEDVLPDLGGAIGFAARNAPSTAIAAPAVVANLNALLVPVGDGPGAAGGCAENGPCADAAQCEKLACASHERCQCKWVKKEKPPKDGGSEEPKGPENKEKEKDGGGGSGGGGLGPGPVQLPDAPLTPGSGASKDDGQGGAVSPDAVISADLGGSRKKKEEDAVTDGDDRSEKKSPEWESVELALDGFLAELHSVAPWLKAKVTPGVRKWLLLNLFPHWAARAASLARVGALALDMQMKAGNVTEAEFLEAKFDMDVERMRIAGHDVDTMDALLALANRDWKNTREVEAFVTSVKETRRLKDYVADTPVKLVAEAARRARDAEKALSGLRRSVPASSYERYNPWLSVLAESEAIHRAMDDNALSKRLRSRNYGGFTPQDGRTARTLWDSVHLPQSWWVREIEKDAKTHGLAYIFAKHFAKSAAHMATFAVGGGALAAGKVLKAALQVGAAAGAADAVSQGFDDDPKKKGFDAARTATVVGLAMLGTLILGGAIRMTRGGPGTRFLTPEGTELELRFSQRTASATFQEGGTFEGSTIGSVSNRIRSGALTAEDLPVGYVSLDAENALIVNTRSSLALRRAGIPPSEWKLIDQGGTDVAEAIRARLADQRPPLGPEGIDVIRITDPAYLRSLEPPVTPTSSASSLR